MNASIDMNRIQAQARIFRDSRLVRSQGNIYPLGCPPQTAAQRAALDSLADILFFGGAAGSLKTETMLVDAARESGNPNLRAIIFRQQFTQMTDIVDKTHKLYKAMGANYVGQPSWTWTFPSGAKIRLYGIYTFITTTEKPRDLVIADHCRQLAEQGDLTSA